MKYLSLVGLLCISFLANAQTPTFKEKYRPQFHFTPAINWTNDPNGLVYLNGEYHLFLQYNPYGNRWGHMSWGHAVSTDLIHWKHLPVAIPEANGTMIFSGSAVIDAGNTTGFGKGGATPMVAVYTGHYIADSTKPDDYIQSQQIAYSLDKGRTFTKYTNNPVLDLHKRDFRDPKAFWYAPEKKWVMTVVFPQDHIVQLYSSKNLKEWTHLSDFGPAGDIHDIWECSDLLQVPVEGTGKMKWVLLNSQQVTMQYFVGEFDGTKFTAENSTEKVFRPDYGPDFYAGITYNHLPAGKAPVFIGWANNWSYANDIPTFPWKSAMALPRELHLRKVNGEWILLQKPTPALQALRVPAWQSQKISVSGIKQLPVKSQQCELEITLQPGTNANSGIRLAVGTGSPFLIGYDAASHKLYIDRTGAGDTSFNKRYPALSHYEKEVPLQNGKIRLHVYFDHSLVEVFANDGDIAFTTQIFPSEENTGIELFSNGGTTEFTGGKIWKMKSVWVGNGSK